MVTHGGQPHKAVLLLYIGMHQLFYHIIVEFIRLQFIHDFMSSSCERVYFMVCLIHLLD